MNVALLHRLRRAGGFVPWDRCGPDRVTTRRDVDELLRFGFALDTDPHDGIRYAGPAARLCAEQIEWDLGTRVVGRRVVVRSRVGSTNDLAAEAGSSRFNDGLAVFAEEQTAGRGQRGRVWTAPAGSSLLVSVLLFPPPTLDRPNWLTALAALAVAEVVGPDARIKWPNDVRVDGRKVAGILVERGRATVVGIGLNVNLAAADLPAEVRDRATSLQILRGGPLDRSDVARDLLRRLDHWFGLAVTAGPGELGEPWWDRCEHRGRDVAVETTAGGRVAGRVDHFDPRRLCLNDRATGGLREIPTHEIRAVHDDVRSEPGG